jgi:alkylated DNA repair dioxygenase AlkB
MFDNWVNEQTREFISKLSFNGYILAGNSVSNMSEGIPLQGDLDFWVQDKKYYLNVLDEIIPYYDHINFYPSMVELYREYDLPRINIILTNLTPEETIARFDFDYTRCYWTPSSGIVYGRGCKKCLKTKIIKHHLPFNKITRKRILKAVKYGYFFPWKFWNKFSYLLNDDNGSYRFTDIKLEHLNLDEFKLDDATLHITDVNNISATLNELGSQYEKLFEARNNIKLPVLLSFTDLKNNYELITAYVESIIFINPLSDVDYYNVRLGENFIMSHKCPPILENVYDKKKRVIQLNKSGTAYIIIDHIPHDLNNLALDTFNMMYKLHPDDRHKIIMFENEINVSRYSQSYLHTPNDLSHTVNQSYMYSGFDTSTNNMDLPELFRPYYDYMKTLDPKYNQVIANWYEDNYDYIAFHSDCQKNMIDDAKISIISLYPSTGDYRSLKLKPKSNNIDSLREEFTINLHHGTIITMCGTTQDEFRHGIMKENKECSNRISLSFRQMIQ